MGTTRIRIDPDDPTTIPQGRIAPAVVDATTEADIALQEREDEAEAMQDMARYTRRIRRRLGLSQTELARRIDFPALVASRSFARNMARPLPSSSLPRSGARS